MRMQTIPRIFIAISLVFLGAGCANPTARNVPPATQDVPTATGTQKAPSAGNRLNLSGTGLDRLPAYVLERTDLEELDISNNRLTGALPSEIGRLVNLKVVDASGNQMTGVPAEVGKLRDLRTLDLSNNRLTGLPMELGQLSNLEVLDLSGNDIAKQDLDGIRRDIPNAKIIE